MDVELKEVTGIKNVGSSIRALLPTDIPDPLAGIELNIFKWLYRLRLHNPKFIDVIDLNPDPEGLLQEYVQNVYAGTRTKEFDRTMSNIITHKNEHKVDHFLILIALLSQQLKITDTFYREGVDTRCPCDQATSYIAHIIDCIVNWEAVTFGSFEHTRLFRSSKEGRILVYKPYGTKVDQDLVWLLVYERDTWDEEWKQNYVKQLKPSHRNPIVAGTRMLTQQIAQLIRNTIDLNIEIMDGHHNDKLEGLHRAKNNRLDRRKKFMYSQLPVYSDRASVLILKKQIEELGHKKMKFNSNTYYYALSQLSYMELNIPLKTMALETDGTLMHSGNRYSHKVPLDIVNFLKNWTLARRGVPKEFYPVARIREFRIPQNKMKKQSKKATTLYAEIFNATFEEKEKAVEFAKVKIQNFKDYMEQTELIQADNYISRGQLYNIQNVINKITHSINLHNPLYIANLRMASRSALNCLPDIHYKEPKRLIDNEKNIAWTCMQAYSSGRFEEASMPEMGS